MDGKQQRTSDKSLVTMKHAYFQTDTFHQVDCVTNWIDLSYKYFELNKLFNSDYIVYTP